MKDRINALRLRYRQWKLQHPDAVFNIAYFGGLIALFLGLFLLIIKGQKNLAEYNEQMSDWLVKQNAAGKTVAMLADGTHVAFDSDSMNRFTLNK